MKESNKEKGIRLANQAIKNPELLELLDHDKYVDFVLGVAKYDTSLAKEIESLRPFVSSSAKLLFWEAVGILMPTEDYS